MADTSVPSGQPQDPNLLTHPAAPSAANPVSANSSPFMSDMRAIWASQVAKAQPQSVSVPNAAMNYFVRPANAQVAQPPGGAVGGMVPLSVPHAQAMFNRAVAGGHQPAPEVSPPVPPPPPPPPPPVPDDHPVNNTHLSREEFIRQASGTPLHVLRAVNEMWKSPSMADQAKQVAMANAQNPHSEMSHDAMTLAIRIALGLPPYGDPSASGSVGGTQ